MIVEKFDGSVERKILIAMIVNFKVIGRISAKWNSGGLFQNKWCNIVGNWCVKFYQKHQKSLDRSIETRFQRWALKHEYDKENIELITKFLVSLNQEYTRLNEDINADFILDTADDWFNQVKLDRLCDKIKELLKLGKVKEAEELRFKSNKIEVAASSGVDFFNDKQAILAPFQKDAFEVLIPYEDGLGEFFGTALRRKGFVALIAGEKVGKSTWMIDMVYRALLNRMKVAYFILGDMDDREVYGRLEMRMTGMPEESSEDRNWPCKISIPNSIELPTFKQGPPKLDRKDVVFERSIKVPDVEEAITKIRKRFKSDKCFLKISVNDAKQLSAAGIDSLLETWKCDFVPDVVVVDYADNLDSITHGNLDPRHKENENWTELKRISSSRDCLVITATQVNRGGYGNYVIARDNISEDKRKLAHVTALFAIQSTSEEKDIDCQRLNCLGRRKGKYNELRCCFVAGQPAIGHPSIKSIFPSLKSQISLPKKKKEDKFE